MVKQIFKTLLILLIYEECFNSCACHDISTQANKINYDNGVYNNEDSSITNDYEDIPKSDILATTPDFVTKYGYPVEPHTVTTEDGYLLTVHRIPGSPRAASSGVKTPVLVMHGIYASSDTFVLMGSDKSLGFLLADQGYDVWLGNSRGNFYSRKHVTLSPKNPKFWNFSFHEMGVYDLPALIDHILETTNQKQLFYVGHSMGTTIFYVMTSMRPEYNKKIRLGVSMAPAVFVNPVRSGLFKLGARNAKLLHGVLTTAGMYELLPRAKSLQTVLGQVCRDGNPLLEICMAAYSAAFGLHREAFYTENAPVLFSHLFAGGSLQTAVHFAENVVADRFQVYDPTITLGRITPEYNLSQVSAPVYLLYAANDAVVHPDAVMKLKERLPNVVRLHRLPDDLASHTDFVFAKNVKQLVYDEMIEEMNRHK